jgi:hypothetical protein
MTTGEGIYLVRDDGSLVELAEQAYESEALLQQLLERYPSLLAGNQMNPGAPRRWVLVAREAGVPSRLGGGTQWSVDHVFLDQDGVPTIVEVKRSTDTRIRREVVGQMLDYAANAVAYWPVETIRAAFERTCADQSTDPAAAILALTGSEEDIDGFWARVKVNLQARRIRMVFVADRIPAELQRIVEFLNEQMDPAEVLAVEVRQFTGQGITTLAPRVVGQTSAAQRQKGAGAPPGSSFQERLANAAPEVQQAARLLDRWATGAGLVGRDGPGSRAWYAGRISLLNLNPASAAVQFGIEPIRQAAREAEADAVHALLSQIAGRPVAPQWPTLPCSLLVARWQTIEEQLLPSYLTARLERHESSESEPSSAGE